MTRINHIFRTAPLLLIALFYCNQLTASVLSSFPASRPHVGVYLNPDAGRFWTEDTLFGNQVDPLSLHKYLYCGSSPIDSFDPSGQFTLTEMMETVGVWGRYVLSALAPTGLGGSVVQTWRIAIGISIIGIEAGYVFEANPGLAAIQQTDGKVYGGKWWSSPGNPETFTSLLKEQPPASVSKVVITGHCHGDAIKLGDEFIGIFDMSQSLSPVLAPGAEIILNGCHSAGMAQDISAKLPDAHVTGYRKFIIGGSAFGFNDALGFSSVTYINGKETK